MVLPTQWTSDSIGITKYAIKDRNPLLYRVLKYSCLMLNENIGQIAT